MNVFLSLILPITEALATGLQQSCFVTASTKPSEGNHCYLPESFYACLFAKPTIDK